MAATTTVAVLMASAWEILNDPAGALFFPVANMYKWINEGVEKIRQRRPDCLLADAGTLITITAVTGSSSVISLDNRWIPALLEWVLFRCYDADSEDRRDEKLAKTHLSNFELAVTQ